MSTESTAGRKTERLEARIPGRQKAILQRAASMQGQSLTDFVVVSATEAARRVIRENEVLELSERDQRGFAEALLNPRDASDRLKRAAREYLEQTL